jgi:5'(3')-deoxyribonucleotidase
MKPIVFFDFDDTMVLTNPLVVAFLNSYYKIEIPTDVFLCGNSLEKVVNSLLPAHKAVTREELYEDYAKFFLGSREWHEKSYPLFESDVYVPKLASVYDLWIVTARQDGCRPLVEELCERFFPGHITGIHFVWKRVGVRDFQVNKTKSDFIASFTGEKVAYFDDNPGEIRRTRDVISSYLFDPHGHHHADTDIRHRVSSWEEIAHLLLK